MSSKLSKNGVYKILVAPKQAITKITGIIIPESIDTLKNELGGDFTILKSTHFSKRELYRYLACVMPEEKNASSSQTQCEYTRHQSTQVHMQPQPLQQE
jgi:hypothetical protein